MELTKRRRGEREGRRGRAERALLLGELRIERMFLKRLGLRVLKKSVYPHLFRHGSSTY
jgi:hypothetical protein